MIGELEDPQIGAEPVLPRNAHISFLETGKSALSFS